jgi:transposase
MSSASVLPPSAPELNPVEYLWAWLKPNPLANSFFGSLDHMRSATYKALRSAQARDDTLRALALRTLSYLRDDNSEIDQKPKAAYDGE